MRRGSGTREKVSSRRINLECNTYVHESNARNLPVQLSLSQLAKTFGPSYYYLYSLFNEIRDKGKQFLPGREGVKGEWEGVEEKVMGGGVGGRNDQNIV
jgi:hypothetical protein